MNKLKLKITECCDANCLCCQSRLDFYQKKHEMNDNVEMPLNLAKKCIDQAKKIAWDKLIISGGEPTLVNHLPDIVEYGNLNGFQTSMYTNGGNLSYDLIDKLIKSGLDIIMVSYYSDDKEIFTKVRQNDNLFDKVIKNLHLLKEAKNNNPEFKVYLQTVLTKYNFSSIGNLLSKSVEMGFEMLCISYLEHAQSNIELYINEEQINYIRSDMIEEINAVIDRLPLEMQKKEIAIRMIKSIYDKTKGIKDNDYAKGIYQKRDSIICRNKDHYIVVDPNGNILPCCGLEYYLNRAKFDNINEKELSDILNSETYRSFWDNSDDICQYCGINLHFSIPTN